MFRALVVAVVLVITGTWAAVEACSIAPKTIWWMEGDSADPLFRFVQKGKVGYIDAVGKVAMTALLPYEGNDHGEFHEGLLRLSGGAGTRYVDSSGKTVIRTSGHGMDFSDGLAAVSVGSEPSKYGFIDRSGRFVIPATYDYVGAFSEGLAPVWSDAVGQGSRMKYIDRMGKVAISTDFSTGTDFHEARAAVIFGPCRSMGCGSSFAPTVPGMRSDCRWGYIDREGHLISALRFEHAGDFSEGLAAVEMGGLWGYLDRDGKIAIKPQFQDAMEFSESRAAVRMNGKWGFIDRAGRFVISPRLVYVHSFSYGRAPVAEEHGVDYYIDKSGKRAFLGEFRIATPFRHGLADVQLKDGRFAYLNTSGKIIFTYKE